MTERRWGLGGRVAGMWASEEMAAEEDEVESMETVRVRSFGCRGAGRVATERAEDIEVRREGMWWSEEGEPEMVVVGEVERLECISMLAGGGVEEICAETSEVVARGAMGRPNDWPRMRG